MDAAESMHQLVPQDRVRRGTVVGVDLRSHGFVKLVSAAPMRVRFSAADRYR